MQDILTNLIETITISFLVLMAFDFLSGIQSFVQLVQLEQVIPSAVPQGDLMIEPLDHQLPQRAATIDWLETAILQLQKQTPEYTALSVELEPVNVVELARARQNRQEFTSKEALAARPDVKLQNIKTYMLHKHQVMYVQDLQTPLLPGVKTYMLRGRQVVRVADLEVTDTFMRQNAIYYRAMQQ